MVGPTPASGPPRPAGVSRCGGFGAAGLGAAEALAALAGRRRLRRSRRRARGCGAGATAGAVVSAEGAPTIPPSPLGRPCRHARRNYTGQHCRDGQRRYLDGGPHQHQCVEDCPGERGRKDRRHARDLHQQRTHRIGKRDRGDGPAVGVNQLAQRPREVLGVVGKPRRQLVLPRRGRAGLLLGGRGIRAVEVGTGLRGRTTAAACVASAVASCPTRRSGARAR
ncbi:hypothetical protein I552_0282 [Mycobacterium xenopi 3993]|nr:hypothetical protein I552_0282 [Mycobacterium xenopi 3993]